MDFLNRTEAMGLASDNKLIGFGAGVLGAKTQRFMDNRLEYFIDNEEMKQGSNFEGGPVKSLSALDGEDLSKTVIVVCTEQYKIVREQVLAKYPQARMYRTPLLKEYAVFDRLLNCSEKLLVSAYGASGGLYLVNGRTEQYKLLREGSFRGIVRVKDRIIVATEQGALWEIQSFEPFKYKELYKPRDITQMHGLVYWEKENMIIGAEAQHNTISFFDATSFEKLDTLSIAQAATRDKKDACHVNDLCIKNDSLFISMLSKNGWWREGIFDGAVLEMDLNEKGIFTTVATNLLFPHSIRFIGNKFYILESMRGMVVLGGNIDFMQLNGYIRGIEGDDDILYVGQSRNRRVSEALLSHQPISMDSGLYVISPEHKVYRFIKLPEMSDVYNIMDLEAVAK